MCPAVALALLLSPHAAPPRGPYGGTDWPAVIKKIVGRLEYPAERLVSVSEKGYSAFNEIMYHFQAEYRTKDHPETVLVWYGEKVLRGRPRHLPLARGFYTERARFPGGMAMVETGGFRMTRYPDGMPVVLRRPMVLSVVQTNRDFTWTAVISRSPGEPTTRIALAVMRNHDEAAPLSPLTGADYLAWQFAADAKAVAKAWKGKTAHVEGTVVRAGEEGGFSKVHLKGHGGDKVSVSVECLMNRLDGRYAAGMKALKPGDVVRVAGYVSYEPGKGGRPGRVMIQGARFAE